MSQKLFDKQEEEKLSEEHIDAEAQLDLDSPRDHHMDLNNKIDFICSQNYED